MSTRLLLIKFHDSWCASCWDTLYLLLRISFLIGMCRIVPSFWGMSAIPTDYCKTCIVATPGWLVLTFISHPLSLSQEAWTGGYCSLNDLWTHQFLVYCNFVSKCLFHSYWNKLSGPGAIQLLPGIRNLESSQFKKYHMPSHAQWTWRESSEGLPHLLVRIDEDIMGPPVAHACWNHWKEWHQGTLMRMPCTWYVLRTTLSSNIW